jgi:hypothetical protein
MSKSMLIMVAGPYRSGTGDNPEKMEENLAMLESTALSLWQRGHMPVIGEWLALPLIKQAGSTAIGDAVWNSIGYPAADRILEHCDAVLRLAGQSKGADGDVLQAQRLGIPVYNQVDDIPLGTPKAGRAL